MRIGLVGCGRIAQIAHLGALAAMRDVTIVALAEPDAARRLQAGRRAPHAALFTDYRELLATSEAEAVVLTLPPALHAEAAMAALEAGKHVYVEKPLATSLEGARAVLEARERSGMVGMMGFNFRFHPLYRALRQQVQTGRVGRVAGARSVFCAAARRLPPWKESRGTGGGALLDLASHHIDVARFVFEQEVAEVSAAVRSVQSEHDTVSLQLRMADGVLVQSFFSMTATEEDRFEVYGNGGKLAVDRYRMRTLEFFPPQPARGRVDRLGAAIRLLGRTPRRIFDVLWPPDEGTVSFRAALGAFVEAVTRQQPAPVSLEEGVRSLAVVLAAEQSARTGRTIMPATPHWGAAHDAPLRPTASTSPARS